jgi:hypothetical protein
MVDGQHRERVGEVLCCVNQVGEREMRDQVERSEDGLRRRSKR